jgi:hypothetical protein
MRRPRIWAHGKQSFRGRVKGSFRPQVETRLLEYLAELSVRNGVDSEEFFIKLVEAWKNEKSAVEKLTIERRSVSEDDAMFLIINDSKVVAQLSIPKHILLETKPLNAFEYVSEQVNRTLEKRRQKIGPYYLRIGDLKVGMKRVSLRAKVTGISKPRVTLTGFDDYVTFAHAILSDNTSTIKITLWNNWSKTVSVNDILQIENAAVVKFRGELFLRTGRSSRVTSLDKDQLMETQALQETPDTPSFHMHEMSTTESFS